MSHANGSHNTSRHRIEVTLKSDFNDAEGKEALSLLHDAGLHTAREVRASRIYEIRGSFTAAQANQAAKELLCDPVTQEYRLLSQTPSLNGMNHWRVEVWLKPTVTDTVGESVKNALIDMGLPEPQTVRSAIAYRITGKCGRNHIEKAVTRALSNPLIHMLHVAEDHA